MKVSELTGAQLDYWVARANGKTADELAIEQGNSIFSDCVIYVKTGAAFQPSKRWSQCGTLIEKYKNHPQMEGTNWNAIILCDNPLQAICRAVVRAVLGDEVPDAPAAVP